MDFTRNCVLALILLSYSHGSNAKNITLGSTLTAGTNSVWHSSNGDFAFGFYELDAGRFLIGIWFDKIPSKTLVWSSNRDNPAPWKSTVGLTKDGLLVATYFNGKSYPIYKARAAAYAVMQDDGNLVLRDSSSSVLWESFSSPTDTILPGQVLRPGQEIFSNAIGNMEYSTGSFRLQMQQDGNLVLSAYQFADFGYWDARTPNKPNMSLVFNNSATMYLRNATDIVLRLTNMSLPIEDYYHRATVDDYGNFQQYVYRKAGDSQWTQVWKAVTSPCSVNAVCGVYGYCTTPDNQQVVCECLIGFIPLDPQSLRKGCYPEVTSEQLYGKTRPSGNFSVKVYKDSDLPNGPFTDMAKITPANIETCTKEVLDDWYCMGATLVDAICYKKRMPFFNARRNLPSTRGVTLLIKGATSPSGAAPNSKHDSNYYVIAGLLTSSLLAFMFIAITIYYGQVIREYRQRNISKEDTSLVEINLREFTYKQLSAATNGFSDKLGQGASGTVYRGTLMTVEKEIEIAVKELERVVERSEKEFTTEVKVIGQTHHRNLVRLLGFCGYDNHRFLVYELMKNGSLSGFLFREGNKPSWDVRVEIVLGIARGLLYLHEGQESPIIHCDIKPQNVLLNEYYRAKISDFGLAKLLMRGGTRTSTNVRGTMGYMAPEWLKNVPVTPKVDVYSFGVMLLEIICCRRHVESDQIEGNDEEEVVLIDWVLMCLKFEKLEMVVKHDEEALSDFKRFERMARVGIWCIQPDPVLRPPMKKVMQMLEGVIEVGEPPLVSAQTY